MRRVYTVLILLLSAASVFGDESHDSLRLITLAESFVTDAEASTIGRLPIVIFISQHGCPYCEVLRDQVLFPMARSGQLQEKSVFRELSLDAGFTVTDFNGAEIAGRKFADRYAASVTPTLLFLDAEGNEIAGKLIGISNIEYYNFYYGKALKAATAAIE